MPLGLRPLSAAPLSSIFGTPAEQATSTRVFRFSTKGFATRTTDAPAHEHIPGLLKQDLRLGRRVVLAEGDVFGPQIEAAYGEIQLDNSLGQLDEMVRNYRADGRRVTMKIGAAETTNLGRRRVQAYQLFETVYTTVAHDMFHEENTVRITLSSLRKRLQDRIQQQTYSGLGGISGTADMVGRSLPIALGRNLNVPAQILEPAVLTYDLNGGPISEVIAVYDAGIELTFNANFTSYSALVAASIPDGAYATSLAVGKIKLGTQPFGQITADLRGEIDNSNGFYVGNHASIMRMVLRDFAAFTNAELDLDSFDVLNAVQTWEMGLFLPAGDQSTVADVVDAIALSCGAIAGQDRSGLFRVKRLETPKAQPDWIFTDRDILRDRFRRERLPYRVPFKRWGVGYGRNNTIQTDTQLAELVSDSRKTFLESEYRTAYATNATIAQGNKTSSIAPFRQALFLTVTGAEEEAARLQALYNYDASVYRFTVKNALFSIELGQTVRIILDMYELQNGRNFVVTEAYDNADLAETEIVCFG